MTLSLPSLCLFLGNVSHKVKWMARFQTPFLVWSFFLFGWAVILGDVNLSESIFTTTSSNSFLLPAYIMSLFGILSTLLRDDLKRSRKITLAVFIALVTFSFFLQVQVYQNSETRLGALLFILTMMTASIYFAMGQRRRLFNLLILLVAIRFLVVYFQVFGSLAMTGVGLIFSGLLIICVALLWFKYQARLSAWVEDALNAK